MRIESRSERLTGDAGALLLRDGLERLGFVVWLGGELVDRRNPVLIVHPLPELVLTSIFCYWPRHRVTRTTRTPCAMIRCFAWRHPHGEVLLKLYRQRGTAEGHMGELMDVLAPALSSTLRPKTTYRGYQPKPTEETSRSADIRAGTRSRSTRFASCSTASPTKPRTAHGRSSSRRRAMAGVFGSLRTWSRDRGVHREMQPLLDDREVGVENTATGLRECHLDAGSLSASLCPWNRVRYTWIRARPR